MKSIKNMCGVILAGGTGSRLFPLTWGISKALLPVYQQPMIFYPLKTLIDMGIKDILIIIASDLQYKLFYAYLGNGSKFGVNLEYIIQDKPNGLPEAFILGEYFIGKSDVTLILGDNIFLTDKPIHAKPNTIYTYKVKNPEAYGVASLKKGKLYDIVEKPKSYVSDDAVVGLYIFSSFACTLAKNLRPSDRGELEIVDLIKRLNWHEGVSTKEFSGVWFDCGTPDDLLECGEFVRALTRRTSRDILLKEI